MPEHFSSKLKGHENAVIIFGVMITMTPFSLCMHTIYPSLMPCAWIKPTMQTIICRDLKSEFCFYMHGVIYIYNFILSGFYYWLLSLCCYRAHRIFRKLIFTCSSPWYETWTFCYLSQIFGIILPVNSIVHVCSCHHKWEFS